MTTGQMFKSNLWISMLNICVDRKFFIHESISCLRWRVTMMDRSFNGPCHEIKPTDSLFFHRGFVFNSNIWQRCLSGDRTEPWKTKTRNDVFDGSDDDDADNDDDGEDNVDGDGDEDEESLEKKLEIMLFDTKWWLR